MDVTGGSGIEAHMATTRILPRGSHWRNLYLGYYPRISTEQSDSFQSRIDKIQDLISDSKYSIHEKRGLVLEEEKYRYQVALSDFSGFDIQHHQGDYREAVRKVRNWFANETRESVVGAGRILSVYEDFQEWHYKRRLSRGFSERDIQDYPTCQYRVRHFAIRV